jgi:hypothetical protein
MLHSKIITTGTDGNPGNAPKYNPEVLFPTMLEMMGRGCFPEEVAAAVNVAWGTFQKWLNTSSNEELREVYNIALTKCKAFWLSKGREGALKASQLEAATYKLLMVNEFGYSDKVQTKDTTEKPAVSEADLDARIKALLEKQKSGE